MINPTSPILLDTVPYYINYIYYNYKLYMYIHQISDYVLPEISQPVYTHYVIANVSGPCTHPLKCKLTSELSRIGNYEDVNVN